MLQRPRGVAPSRWQRVFTFDESVYAEILRDASATVPAVLTVAAVMFVSGLGGFLWWLIEDFPGKGEFFLESVVIGSLIATGLFFVWAQQAQRLQRTMSPLGDDGARARITCRPRPLTPEPLDRNPAGPN